MNELGLLNDAAKPGVQTSEWKSKLGAQLLALVAGSGQIDLMTIDPKYALAMLGLLEGLYLVSRTLIKLQTLRISVHEKPTEINVVSPAVAATGK